MSETPEPAGLPSQYADDPYTDEAGVTWTRPTAYAYAMVCKQSERRSVDLQNARAEILELKKDLDEAYRLNKTRYDDGYRAAAGPQAAERIERLSRLWEGAKQVNRVYLVRIEDLETQLAELLKAPPAP